MVPLSLQCCEETVAAGVPRTYRCGSGAGALPGCRVLGLAHVALGHGMGC